MSYAVIQSGGKQYKVKSGEILKIEKLPNSKSDTKIEFKDILAYGDNKVIEIGSPTIQGAKVEANLIKNSKNRTVLIFKKRRRQNSRRKNGHRQEYSMIRINKIFSKDGKILSEAEKISKPTKKDSEKKELAKRPGIIKERAQLMDIAYREDTDIEDRTIDSHVKRIRKKFKKVDPEFSAIETRYGSGYRWNVS